MGANYSIKMGCESQIILKGISCGKKETF